MKLVSLFLVICFSNLGFSWAQNNIFMTPFEKNSNTSANYSEVIQFYERLDEGFKTIQLTEAGSSDSGFPIHTVIFSKNEDFNRESIRDKGKVVLFINNAIHPGEPCGVDATMMLLRDFATKADQLPYLDNVAIVAIPFYNIGGGLNRGRFSRANQQGPEAYGFRGNAQNLDLNRDFVKCDSRNAQTFNKIFTYWQPDVFIDNHTSNGADYQYTMTLIATQHNKLSPPLAGYLNKSLLPALYDGMEKAGWEMTPYVYARDIPDNGIAAFLDLPRYSSGYAALFNTLSFMPETHMLKPFEDRVRSTYAFMEIMVKYLHRDHKNLQQVRKEAIAQTKSTKTVDLNWEMDTDDFETIKFKGYEAAHKPSKVSGIDRLYYDRNKPFEKEITYFNSYKPSLTVNKPVAYIFPQAYQDVVERLQWNGVVVKRLSEDSNIPVEMYKIVDFKTRDHYEGHYLHSNVEVKKLEQNWLYRKGDYLVLLNQFPENYIVNTLEPHAPDSFFAWNFFDGILMQKEYFSPYVFEDLADEFLKSNPDVKAALEEKKAADPEFAKSAYQQLDFIYKRSPWYEKTFRLYPVGRIMLDKDLPEMGKE